MGKEKTILINYTGRLGGGPLDSYEIARTLLLYTSNVVAVVSEYVENLEEWQKLPLKKLVIIPTYNNHLEFIASLVSYRWKIRRKIKRSLDGFNISEIYCPMVCFFSQKINRLFPGAKTYVALHDPIPHSKDKMPLAGRLLELLGFGVSREIYSRAEGIIVHSRQFVEFVEQKYDKKGKVYYLPLGRHDFYKNVVSGKPIMTYDPNKYNFLFFGRISHYKGIGILLDAYAMLEERYGNVSLTVAGQGDMEEFEPKCRGLKNLTVINRWINDCEVDGLFRGENIIMVVPYLDATQSGVVLVAMDYLVPVIASRTGGLVEQVEDGVTGILVEPGNVQELELAMERLICDETARKRLIENEKKYLEVISWDKIAKNLLEIMGYQAS